MRNIVTIRKPFFEIGPKTYLYGDAAVEMAIEADRLSEKYGVDIIFSAQYTDIAPIVKVTKNIKVFAQHMDPVLPGRGVGAVLPESLKAAGAVGVLLNHAEKPLTLDVLLQTIQRAQQVGLATLVCAGSCEEAKAVAILEPDIILAESPALIGKGRRGPQDTAEIIKINNAIYQLQPGILVLHGAGIKDEKDVFEVIKAGADATGSTSGVLLAEKPYEMMEKMISSVADAWRERNKDRG
ncbi:triose-phosphate isomerase [Serratia fonticola]|uniref:triose-phosphate isomerase n=1 Tax=Serratia fonticola TaxID=47917 RepID=UPI00192CF897|nr:triose-phosphate isomerase [Serratia fonticola]MBL5825695.1 triose-phosphate isomerase [Serratia fonticola]